MKWCGPMQPLGPISGASLLSQVVIYMYIYRLEMIIDDIEACDLELNVAPVAFLSCSGQVFARFRSRGAGFVQWALSRPPWRMQKGRCRACS